MSPYMSPTCRLQVAYTTPTCRLHLSHVSKNNVDLKKNDLGVILGSKSGRVTSAISGIDF